MTDIIREKIKNSPSNIAIKKVETEINSKNESQRNKTLLSKLNSIAQPVTQYSEPRDLKDIQLAVSKVNHGQKKLESLRRAEVSPAYGIIYNLQEKFLVAIGRSDGRLNNVYSVFEYQQQNVRDLNRTLAVMASSYDEEVKTTRETLDELLKKTSKETSRVSELENKEIGVEVKNYQESLRYLSDFDKSENPEKYYEALQKVIDSKRSGRKKRFEYVIATTGQEHHEGEIDNLMLQEELFETLLYGITELAFRTELYQRTLDNNLRIWKPTRDLSLAVGNVTKGISVLSDFNDSLNDSFIQTVSEMSRIIHSNSGYKNVEGTNRKLKQLVEDVTSGSYIKN